ncbi:MAG: UDP-glucose 4-epimerase [Patescibacteria group bacterium]|nr:UDP-glucose 4-epimerase [Patescibacteria group bacterium]
MAEKLSRRKSNKVFVVGKDVALSKNNCENIEYVQLDLTEQSDEFKQLADSADVAVIMTQPNERIIDNLISTIKSTNRLKKIVYLSSALIYDNFEDKQNETFSPNPMTDYERGKLTEEQKLEKFTDDAGFNLCVARLSNVYGDVKNRGLINFVFLSLLNDEELTINGKGDSVRDYIFVEDVVDYIDFLIFWDQKREKETFNICTGKGYSVIDVVQTVEKIAGKEIKNKFSPAVPEKGMIIGNNKKIVELSGMKPKYDLVKGLRQTYKNYLANK